MFQWALFVPLLLEFPEALGHLVGGLTLEVHLDLLDLIITHLLVVLYTLSLHLVKEFLSHFDSFLVSITEVLVHDPAVEIV